jgi:hypothetical protein
VQAFENVLYDVLGSGQVAHHDQREPHEFQVMLAEQFGQPGPGPVLAVRVRCRKAHAEETPAAGPALHAGPTIFILALLAERGQLKYVAEMPHAARPAVTTVRSAAFCPGGLS